MTSLLPRGPVALLALEDGSILRGHAFGACEQEASGEVVFHTGMSGYPEILTDPSYHGQIVSFTYPHVGNYGMPPEDDESGRIQVAGLVARQLCRHPSGARPAARLERRLEEAGVLGVEGVDTRALTLRLRERGSLRGVMAVRPHGAPPEFESSLVERARGLPPMEGAELVTQLSIDRRITMPARGESRGLRVAVLHFGAKSSIMDQLCAAGCTVELMPATTRAEEILALHSNGLLLSNGPGDPAACIAAIETVRALLGRLPIFGICLGHQILALAAGARSYKLPFGHHGANHPVRDENSGRVSITSQNHGFAVDEGSLAGTAFQVSHRSLYDSTVEGIVSTELRAAAVQYHPEASPGPHDARHLLDDFVARLERMPSARGDA